MKISVITVCYNAKHTIRKTIKSVLYQDYKEIEYIVVDGNSDDGTKEIIKEYVGKGIIKYITENDSGIYDAMNKGILLAEGEYIQFLNAGDVFFSDKTVSKVVNVIKEVKADIYFGDIYYKYQNGKTEMRKYGRTCCSALYYATGDCINHQAIFANSDCLKNELFSLDYGICADREWMMRMNKQKKKYYSLEIPICYYSLDENSVSIRNIERYKIEADACMKLHYSKLYPLYLFFSFFRNNIFLKEVLHFVYRGLYIKKEK